jgi:photosystem II stability/assembly factor-like uncharacterized protein
MTVAFVPTRSPTPVVTAPPAPVAWAVGGQLVSRSDDRGASWQPIFNVGSGNVLGVDFVDRLHGWVVGETNIYRTTVGGGEDGRAWEDQARNVEGGPVNLYDVAFVDAASGVAVGAAVSAPNGRPLVLATSDAGGHWRRSDLQSLRLPSRSWLSRVCLTEDGHGLAVGTGQLRGISPVVLTTADAGVTWSSAIDAVRLANPPLAALTIAAGACGMSSDLWVAGAPSFLATSSDGGNTWFRLAPTGRSDVLLHAVLFADREPGWVAGFDRFAGQIVAFSTSDGGSNWREQVLAENVVVLEQQPSAALAVLGPSSILFVGDDPNSFALEGARALSLVSTDGGASWTPSRIPGGYESFADVDVVP